jgi:hypothetical protein
MQNAWLHAHLEGHITDVALTIIYENIRRFIQPFIS